jgi:hypothetical protein
LVVTLLVNSSTGASVVVTTAATTQYGSLCGNNKFLLDTVEINRQVVYQQAGTFSKLYVRIIANSTSATSTILTRKNAATDGNLTVSISSAATGVFEDTTNTDTVTAADKWVYKLVTGSGGTLSITIISVLFEATGTTDTYTRCGCGGSNGFATASASRYNTIGGDISSGSATEANSKTRIRESVTAKNLAVVATSNARVNTTTINTRKNGSGTSQLIVSITSGATGIFEDTATTVSLVAGDDYNTSVATGSGTQTLTLSNIVMDIVSTSPDNNGICVMGRITGYTQNAATTDYFAIGGNILTESTESSTKVKTRAAFTFSEITALIGSNTVSAASTIKLRVNGADSSLSASVTASTSGVFSDSSNTVTTSATDDVNTACVTGATGTSLIIRYIEVYTSASTTQLYTRSISETSISVSDSVATLVDSPTTAKNQVVRFQKDTTGTTNATQDVALNFTPKALMVFSDGNTADNTLSAHFQWIQGFSDGTNHACILVSSEDAVVSSSDTYRSHRNDCVYVHRNVATGTVDQVATCTFGTNKVTFTWTTNDTQATYITLVAYGGGAITNVKVNTVTVAKSGTGTQDYTGLGFNPAGSGASVLMTLMSGLTSSSDTDVGIGSFGAAVSSANRYVISTASEDASNPTDSWRTHRTDACLYQFTTAGATDGYADFSAWITDGFRLNVIDAFTNTAFLFSYLVINGGTWDVGSIVSPASAQSSNHSVSVSSKTIKGLVMASASSTSAGNNTILTYNILTVSATDGTTESIIAEIDEDAQTTSDAYRVNAANGVIGRSLTVNGADTETGTFTSFGTNQVTINWTGSPASRYYGYVVLADGAAVGTLFPTSISESTIAVSDSNTRLLTGMRALADTVVVSETVARNLTAIRALAESSIAISETLARLRIAPVVLSESAISVSETLVRRLTANRTLSDTVVVSESLARVLLAMRALADTIVVSETLARRLTANRALAETAISVSESLARLLIAVRALSDTVAVSDSLVALKIGATIVRSITEASIAVSCFPCAPYPKQSPSLKLLLVYLLLYVPYQSHPLVYPTH